MLTERMICMASTPLFSIVIPVYNSAKTIRECLESIVTQSFPDFEVIIVNDGSTDETEKIVKSFSENDSRIKLYSFPNSGVSETRRRGISFSTGEYILQVDSDDTINSELLDRLAQVICKFEFPEVIRFQCELVGDNPQKNHQRYNCHENLCRIMSGMDALKLWSKPGKKYALYWLFCFKKSVFAELLFLPQLRCHEDLALIPILIAKATTVIGIDYVGYNYTYVSESSITNKTDIASERWRAMDFLSAYDYAIENFLKIDNIKPNDVSFFLKDFDARKEDKFNSLSAQLKEELYDLFH